VLSFYTGRVRVDPLPDVPISIETHLDITDLDRPDWIGTGLAAADVKLATDRYRITLLDGVRAEEVAEATLVYSPTNISVATFFGRSGFTPPAVSPTN
jgi:hypothetical protein